MSFSACICPVFSLNSLLMGCSFLSFSCCRPQPFLDGISFVCFVFFVDRFHLESQWKSKKKFLWIVMPT